MISFIEGILAERRPTHVVISCNGVGYHAAIPLSTFDHLPPIGDSCRVLTRLVVREDAQLLFGFATEEERATFDLLLAVSRVGPKLALAMLSGMSVADVRRAIATEDFGRLASVPGVGKRTAQRICVELKDKFAVEVAAFPESGRPGSGDGTINEAVAALVVLGYSRSEAQEAVARATKKSPDAASTEDLIRTALVSKGV
jgi:Holliday junction DNA helicase RuvA